MARERTAANGCRNLSSINNCCRSSLRCSGGSDHSQCAGTTTAHSNTTLARAAWLFIHSVGRESGYSFYDGGNLFISPQYSGEVAGRHDTDQYSDRYGHHAKEFDSGEFSIADRGKICG